LGLDIPAGQSNSGTYYYVKDARYSTMALTNSSGVAVETYR